MTVGTRTLLFGYHCFFLHGFFVAWAWWMLFGFPRDPRLWACFFLHDIGYFGCKELDNEKGERHPWRGAEIVGWWFDEPGYFTHYGGGDDPDLKTPRAEKWHARAMRWARALNVRFGWCPFRDDGGSVPIGRSDAERAAGVFRSYESESGGWSRGSTWLALSLFHSRSLTKRLELEKPSLLCYADKLAFCFYPTWLIVLLWTLSGEGRQHLAHHRNPTGKYAMENIAAGLPLPKNLRELAALIKAYSSQHYGKPPPIGIKFDSNMPELQFQKTTQQPP